MFVLFVSLTRWAFLVLMINETIGFKVLKTRWTFLVLMINETIGFQVLKMQWAFLVLMINETIGFQVFPPIINNSGNHLVFQKTNKPKQNLYTPFQQFAPNETSVKVINQIAIKKTKRGFIKQKPQKSNQLYNRLN